jgi:predicted MPP superfamily phosphohydrolase
VPLALIWVVPVVYWSRDRAGEESFFDHLVHQAAYLSMAWVSFALVLTLARDVLLLFGLEMSVAAVVVGAFIALVVGAVVALRGPRVVALDLPIENLHPDLDGYRIAQISDLHVGRTIRRTYVARVAELCQSLKPDLVALTGDMVDGGVAQLAPHVAPLASLAQGGKVFYILGNHDCYSGASAWIEHFRAMNTRVLLNSVETVKKGGAQLVVGGVVDPAYRGLRPQIESVEGKGDFRLFLAHNPKLAPLGERAGFDLQLSGHTHAGQFFPWTLAVRLVHAPHVAGLSREGRMQVYVSAGTGTWGPPVRFGTSPELTLIRLVRA